MLGRGDADGLFELGNRIDSLGVQAPDDPHGAVHLCQGVRVPAPVPLQHRDDEMPGILHRLFGGDGIDYGCGVRSQDIALRHVSGLDATVEELPGGEREEKKNNAYGPDSQPGQEFRTARKNVMMRLDRQTPLTALGCRFSIRAHS